MKEWIWEVGYNQLLVQWIWFYRHSGRFNNVFYITTCTRNWLYIPPQSTKIPPFRWTLDYTSNKVSGKPNKSKSFFLECNGEILNDQQLASTLNEFYVSVNVDIPTINEYPVSTFPSAIANDLTIGRLKYLCTLQDWYRLEVKSIIVHDCK